MKIRALTAVMLAVCAGGSGLSASVDSGTGKVHRAVERVLAGSRDGTVKVWVFFVDKGPGAGAALDTLRETYPARALERRALRRTDPGLVDERDLPVSEAYAADVTATGARIHQRSRWVNAVSVRGDAKQIARLAALPCVRAIQPVRTGPGSSSEVRGGEFDGLRGPPPPFHGLMEAELTQIGVTSLHYQGHTAQGVIVGVLDTGFKRTHAAFNQPSHPLVVVAEHDFINNDGVTAPQPGDAGGQQSHGTLILGTLGSYFPGAIVGGAYDASFVLCMTEDVRSETPIEEDNYVAGIEFAEMHGADMTTSSLGYIDWYTQNDLNGLTAVTTIALNTAAANGVHCLTAAGNEGHDNNPATSHLLAPSDAFKVIACGAADGNGAIAGFSSDGPTRDGRVKPELLARGVNTYTVSPSDDNGYATASGTSLSTPLVAGAVACMIQARPTYTVDQMRSILFASAQDFRVTGVTDPLFIRGYGVVDVEYALSHDCNANGLLDAVDLSSGRSVDRNHDGVLDECGPCRPDWNFDGEVNSNDVAQFLDTWFLDLAQGTLASDYDRSGEVNSNDVAAFLNAWFVGCP